MILTKPCPICQHTDVILGTSKEIDFPEQILRTGICENCYNVYCYEIEAKERHVK